jgi:regulator of sirC expression with transglutaminase-like and TPR domain
MNSQQKKINALVSLLGDEDINIRRVARNRLMSFGATALNVLNEVAYSDSEGRIRIEAQSILEEIRISTLLAKFERLQEQEVFDLESASLLLAQVAYPDLEIEECVVILDTLANEAAKLLEDVPDGLKKVEIFNHFFFVKQQFRGNRDAYYDPRNSYINCVLERKIGIPISLSMVYMFIARRLNIPVFGVRFPGHFLLKYVGGNKLFFIDAFNGGLILSVQDCERFSQRMGFKLKHIHLKTSTPEKIFVRMLRNLKKIYEQQDDQHMLTNLKEIFHDYL